MSLFRGEGRSVGPPNTDEVPAHRPGWTSSRGLSSLGGAPCERRRSLTYSTTALFTELPRAKAFSESPLTHEGIRFIRLSEAE